jgi:hypothetical protein
MPFLLRSGLFQVPSQQITNFLDIVARIEQLLFAVVIDDPLSFFQNGQLCCFKIPKFANRVKVPMYPVIGLNLALASIKSPLSFADISIRDFMSVLHWASGAAQSFVKSVCQRTSALSLQRAPESAFNMRMDQIKDLPACLVKALSHSTFSLISG